MENQNAIVFRSVVLSTLITVGIVTLVFTHLEKQFTRTELSVGYAKESESLPVETGTESVADVVAKTIPAVVSVVISADVPVIERYYEEYSPFDDFFGGRFGFSVPRQRQVGTEEREIGGGSGFFVSSDGYIVTNKHVVNVDGGKFSIITNEGASYEVDVVAKDPTLDIAILKVRDSNEAFPHLSFGDSDMLRPGETVIAIGNALAEFQNSVSVGVVSGLARDIVAGDTFSGFETLEGVIQTDAAINRGNSGGPLLDKDGRIIGVNVAVAGNSENIGFALPAAVVEAVYRSVAEYGEIVRPFIGVRYIQVDGDLVERNNLPVEYGALVIRGETRGELAVIPGSPADKAGIEENDVILEIDGKKLDGKNSLSGIIRDHHVGDTISLKIFHDGEEKEVPVTLEKAPHT